MGVAHVSNVARAKPEHFCVKCFGEERASAAIGFAAFLVGTAKGE
jgi:hypothetical protein